MTVQELMELPVTINVVTAARALGIGPNRAYELIKQGRFPVELIDLGGSVRVPTAPLKALLGISHAR
ncbi:DNA-binding protein [Kitasatospora sp. NPDC057692]|uniref:DNA-binding protein n=1 Tax=Kitasatospora sp. NPDC057692 TaxID=3346215 RepID=UPI0036983ECB